MSKKRVSLWIFDLLTYVQLAVFYKQFCWLPAKKSLKVPSYMCFKNWVIPFYYSKVHDIQLWVHHFIHEMKVNTFIREFWGNNIFLCWSKLRIREYRRQKKEKQFLSKFPDFRINLQKNVQNAKIQLGNCEKVFFEHHPWANLLFLCSGKWLLHYCLIKSLHL